MENQQQLQGKTPESNASVTKDPDKVLRQMMGQDYSILIKGGEGTKESKASSKQEASVNISSFVASPITKVTITAAPAIVASVPAPAAVGATNIPAESDGNLFTVIEEKTAKEEEEDHHSASDDVNDDSEDSVQSENDEEGKRSKSIEAAHNESDEDNDRYHQDHVDYYRGNAGSVEEEEKEVFVNDYEGAGEIQTKDPDIESDHEENDLVVEDTKETVEEDEDNRGACKKKEAEYSELLLLFEKHKAKLAMRIPREILEKFCTMVKKNKQLVFLLFIHSYCIDKNE